MEGIKFPANAMQINQAIIEIANFEIISSEDINNKLNHNKQTQQEIYYQSRRDINGTESLQHDHSLRQDNGVTPTAMDELKVCLDYMLFFQLSLYYLTL